MLSPPSPHLPPPWFPPLLQPGVSQVLSSQEERLYSCHLGFNADLSSDQKSLLAASNAVHNGGIKSGSVFAEPMDWRR